MAGRTEYLHTYRTTSAVLSNDDSKKFDDMLLFAMVFVDAAYFIDVLPHRKKAVFSTYNLLNIVYDNRKELLDPYEYKGATTVIDPLLTDEDIDEARKAGLTTFIQVRDKVYLLDSQAVNCDSVADGILAGRILNTIRKNQVEGVRQFGACSAVR